MGNPTKGRGDPSTNKHKQLTIKRQKKTEVVRRPDAKSRQPTTKTNYQKTNKHSTTNEKKEEEKSTVKRSVDGRRSEVKAVGKW